MIAKLNVYDVACVTIEEACDLGSGLGHARGIRIETRDGDVELTLFADTPVVLEPRFRLTTPAEKEAPCPATTP